ncbi:MAG: carboxypeptidase regulatory-like domain-containing protein, partial [Chlamydiia bacterium]|nr:carboxypeptidase regulatory-like domain-containing protein [Chlamydiia bacterium]
YNVFRDGVKLNATLLTVNTYTDMDLAFNMAPGYTYNVTAEYEEGESVYSTDVVVMIDGIGFVNGTVYQLLAPGNPIAGATVTLTNVDGGDNYTFTTDATGMYEGEVYQGTYDYVCAADGYISVSANGVPVGYNLTVSYPFLLDEFPYPVTSVTATEQDENNVLVEWVFNSKEVVEFNIYRSMCDGSDRTLLGSVISGSQFLDQTWGAVTGFGTYKWEVEVQYTNNAASAFSDPCLDKNMEAVVDVKVTTNTVNAPGPEGTFVAFVNTDDVAYNFEVTLDATGMDQIPAVRKGNYDYTVTLDGFAVISGNVDILQDELFEWELMELTNPGFDLYVTPTGYATWIDPNAVEDVTYLSESFDTEIPADWTITDGGDSEDTWYWTPDGTPCASYCMGTLNGTPYLKVDSDAAGSGNHLIETITTAAVDASGAVELFLEFDHFFYKYYGSTGDVDVWDGAAWVNVAHITKGGSWSTPQHKNIDVLAYANADFKVRFTYDDNGSWGYYWAVDDIKISGKAVVSSKEFLSYRVWLDGNFSADTDQAKYQYGDNAEVLVAGQTYFSEVANEYTSGFSAKINYTFTYQPCTAFDGTANLAAVYQGGTADVLVSWDAVADQTIDGVTYEAMGTNVYRDGMMLSFVAAGTTTLLDASLAPATYEYCTEVVYSLDAGAHTWESCA